MYAIESEVSGRIYIGQTSDLDDGLKRHNSGGVYSTKTDRPWKLIANQIFESRSKALRKEGELKRSRGNLLKWLKINCMDF